MRLSRYYLPTLKETPAEATTISHQYCLRAGLVKQTASGIYTWLPLGLRVLSNIMQVIRNEMENIGAIELLMPAVQPAELWKESGRYSDYGLEMLRMQDRHQREMLFGPTHEEVITDVVRGVLKSYRDLPKCLYQIQWKFRDELRPRFGVMRGREFLMKDAYSFDWDLEGATQSYHKMYLAYMKIFRQLGLTPLAVKANTGPIGGNLSHEFHILAETGESNLYYDSKFVEMADSEDLDELMQIYTAADDMHDPKNCSVPPDQLKVSKGIEIGHIFYFGDKYSSKMHATFNDQDGQNKYMHMGSYGIGVSRLVGAIIEAFHDDKGIIWPPSVAPFKIGLINLHVRDELSSQQCEHIYAQLPKEILYDDQDETAGIKFSRMDLIGLPWQVIVSSNLAKDGSVELKNRATGHKEIIAVDKLISHFKQR